jgi:predicted small lipoprotein YifL
MTIKQILLSLAAASLVFTLAGCDKGLSQG